MCDINICHKKAFIFQRLYKTEISSTEVHIISLAFNAAQFSGCKQVSSTSKQFRNKMSGNNTSELIHNPLLSTHHHLMLCLTCVPLE